MHSTFFTIGWICGYESIFTTLLVAVYQLVSIRLDPFGTRRIITTQRCVAACVASWAISGATVTILFAFVRFSISKLIVITSALFITSAIYSIIYYEVSRTSCTDNVQLRQRKAENKRVLRTFGLILGTSVACWSLPLVYWIVRLASSSYDCIETGANIMISMNICANSIIYWWRLKEFRSVFSNFRRWLSKPRAIGPQN